MSDPETADPPFLELSGGWFAQLLTIDQWQEEVSSGWLRRFAAHDMPTPLVYVVGKVTPSTRPGEDNSGYEGAFVAPCGVPEDTPEALYVALINAAAHEALELVQVDGKPYFDPHTEVGDYVLERTLKMWLEWRTGKTVTLE
jgi:hypothetical protein